ncbi:flavin reductase family protein [Paenarthrobacter sp. NPDC089322]|uniref:flavin reductase family protein n=1 Tax=Paenarthrobacter sp. NPDC089322 TaxID=3155065 RepID=UPI003446E9CB
MHINPDDLDAKSNYKMLIGSIIPRPIAWVSTISTKGVRNLAPVSFFTCVGRKPPRVSLSIQAGADGNLKDTFVNIQDTGQFVTNMATFPDALSVHRSAIEFEPDEDEFTLLDVDSAPSQVVRPPRVKSAPIALECEVFKIFEDPKKMGAIVWGTVVNYYVRDDIYLPETGRLDITALAPIGRLAGEYSLTETVFVPPVNENLIQSREGKRMLRLDGRRDDYSPIETDTWTPAGSVLEP